VFHYEGDIFHNGISINYQRKAKFFGREGNIALGSVRKLILLAAFVIS
jgi:hypothetical protein